MARTNLKDGYQQSIRDGDTSEEKKIAVTLEGASPGFFGSLLQGVDFNYIGATYPSSTQESYTYRDGGAAGTIVAVIDVTYTNSSKSDLLTVFRST